MTRITYNMNLKVNPWFAIFVPFIAFFTMCWINIKFLYKNLT